MTATAASRTRRLNLRATFLGGQHESVRSQEVTKAAHRAPGLYWMKFNPAEKWTIARYGQTVASGQPGWELIGLPLATPEHGDEMTRPVAQPLKVREVSKHRAPGLYWVKFNPDEKWTIARYGLTVASGQPGWELIGLPFATRERGDEMTQPAA